MEIWRLQSRAYPLINSEGAKRTGGRWNQPGTPVIYASETMALAALEVMVHHGGIPEDHVAIRIVIPDDLEIGEINLPQGWQDLMPEAVTAEQGTNWALSMTTAVLRVRSATMSVSGFNYVLNPAHPEFARITFSFEPVRFDPRLKA